MNTERIYTKDVSKYIDKEITVMGWVYNIRDLKKIKFIILRDCTGTVQAIALSNEIDGQLFESISRIKPESVVKIKGRVNENKQAKQGYELVIREIEVLSPCLFNKLPIDLSPATTSSLDKRLDNRFLDTRRPEINAIFRIRSQIFKATVEYLDSQGFTKIETPKLTVLGLEEPGNEKSGADLFEVDYFGKKVYLAQSPQLYKQMFVAGGFERVYDIGPVFRAEESHTTRHLTEFTGIDLEMAFIKNENDIMDIVEGLITHITMQVNKTCDRELKLLGKKISIPKKIPRIQFEDIRKLLKDMGKEIDEEDDLDPEAERMLSQYVKDKFDEEFVFALGYPFSKRPFYHMRPEDNPKSTCSFDLLYNGIEIATGSQREHRLGILAKQAKEKGLNLDNMPDYKKIFESGCPPHGGVGLGLDRLTEKLLKLNNIREAVLLPRDPERVRP